MHLFHVQSVQAMHLDDYLPRIALTQWYLGKCARDPLFPAKVLFSDETTYRREGIFNTHNAHAWAKENPHEIRRRAAQTRFLFNVWVSIIKDHLIRPYLLPFRGTERNYLLCLQQAMPQLLGDKQISASTQQTM